MKSSSVNTTHGSFRLLLHFLCLYRRGYIDSNDLRTSLSPVANVVAKVSTQLKKILEAIVPELQFIQDILKIYRKMVLEMSRFFTDNEAAPHDRFWNLQADFISFSNQSQAQQRVGKLMDLKQQRGFLSASYALIAQGSHHTVSTHFTEVYRANSGCQTEVMQSRLGDILRAIVFNRSRLEWFPRNPSDEIGPFHSQWRQNVAKKVDPDFVNKCVEVCLSPNKPNELFRTLA